MRVFVSFKIHLTPPDYFMKHLGYMADLSLKLRCCILSVFIDMYVHFEVHCVVG